MRYYAIKEKKGFLSKLKGKVTEEPVKLSALDKAILIKCQFGADILQIIGCGKPYLNEWGAKEFATTGQVKEAVAYLLKKGKLYRK